MMVSLATALTLLAGCTSADTGAPAAPPGSDSAPGSDSQVAAPGDTSPDSDAPASGDVAEETVPDHVVDDSWIFAEDQIHEIAITLSEASVLSLNMAPYTYVPGSFTFDGEQLAKVGVRLRGKIGSFRTLSGKPKFKIDFNRMVEDQTFWGLEGLALNNEVADCSYLKEPLAAALYEAAGVPASRTGFAQVTVNGAPYGLYVIVELPDDRWLTRVYDAPDGNLYDGKYIWYGGNSYTLLDFADGVDGLFALEEGTDVAHADIIAVSEALITTRGTETFHTDMGEVINWDTFLPMLAADQYIGQNDGYCLNTNNYRVYFHPETGKADFIPCDLDHSFHYPFEWGLSWDSPRGNVCDACGNDPTCQDAWRVATAEVIDIAAAADLVGRFDQMRDVIAAAASDDPRRECSWSSVVAEQNHVRTWLIERGDVVMSKWGL